jgi:pimeloyl-[acyl-carrier protein] methyl ester esterase
MSSALATGELYTESSGASDAAAPLVLLHGWGMNLRVFDGLRAALAQHHRVTAIDLAGHGASPWSAERSPQQQLATLAALLPRAAVLVGWSLGGQLALQLAAEPALAVRRLVLIASSPRFVRAEDWPHGLAAATLRQFAAQLEHDAGHTIDDFIELQLRGSADAAAVRATLQDALRVHGSAAPAALAAGLVLLEHNDLRALARRIEVPALVIAGQYDRVTPPQAGQALAQLLPQGQLLNIRRAGHAPFLSHPGQVAAALLEFTREQAPRWQRAGARATP